MKKHKNLKVGLKIALLLLIIINLISYGYIAYGLYLLSGIETILRYIGIAALLVINILIIIFAIKSIKKFKIGRFILSSIILLIFIAIQSYGGYLIHNVYSSINNMNKDSVTYETYLIVYKDSNIKKIKEVDNNSIGILKDETSIDNYLLALEIIKKENLRDSNTITEYEDTTQMIADLYNNKIDAIFITSNYIDVFSTEEEYENIEKDTRIITKLSKSYTKEEINKIENSGDDIAITEVKIEKPFTVLIMGIDSTAKTLNKNAVGNGDSIIIITFNPKTLNATILSIPRDMYVPISCSNNRERKINSAAGGGINCMKKTIENFFDVKIDYYVKVNFQGVINIVNALGGIDVNVPIAFCESGSNRKWGSSTVYVDQGLQTLNGEQALALARHRKVSTSSKKCPEKYQHSIYAFNDYVRGQNQQLVIQGILNKVKSITSPSQLLTLLDTISSSMDTSFTTEQILSFYNIAKDIMQTSAINSSNVITLDKLFMSGTNQYIWDEGAGGARSMEIPNQSSVKDIKEAMAKNLSTTTALIKTFDFDANEAYTAAIIGKNPTSKTILYSLVGKITGKTEISAISYCKSKEIAYTIVYEESSGTTGIVIKQSYDATKRIDKITNPIVLTISKSTSTNSGEIPNTP
ncbi:MAG TPA: LCP family protein [Bacilli bacterium]|nr:LCP family protein [Bacilli bacterium]